MDLKVQSVQPQGVITSVGQLNQQQPIQPVSNIQAPTQSGVDKPVLHLTHAILLAEHGGKIDYKTQGDNGTSFGGYQWNSQDGSGGLTHFKSDAVAAGLDPNDTSPENQDKVAYAKIKRWKDQGYDPGQIASMWNSGSPNNWKGHSGTTVINGKTIHYDTPAYVNRVKQYYAQLANQDLTSENGYVTPPSVPQTVFPSMPEENKEKKQGLLKKLIRGLANPVARLGVEAYNVGSAVNKGFGHGDFSGAVQELDKTRNLGFLGQVNPAVKNSSKLNFADLAGQGLELGSNFATGGTAGSIAKSAGEQGIKQLVIQGAKKGAIIGATQGLGSGLQHTEGKGLGKNIEDIALSTAVGAGSGGLTGGIFGGLSGAARGAPWSQLSQQNQAKETWDLIQPKLSSNELSSRAASGNVVKSGLKKTVTLIPNENETKIIQDTMPYVVPKDPIATASNINQAISDEADKLIEGTRGTGGTWSNNNLIGAVKSAKVPIGVRGVSEPQVQAVQEYVSMLGSNASKDASGALSVAKQFRSTINDEFGENIWNKDTSIAKYIRNVNLRLNEFAESRLPDGQLSDGTPFMESMSKQKNLYRALENIKVPKVGTNTGLIGKAIDQANSAARSSLRYVPGGEIVKHLLP